MKNKPKLLIIVNTDWFFLSHRLPIAQAAQAQAYEVHIACSLSAKKMELEAHGFIVHELKKMDRRSMNPFSLLISFFELRAIILKIKPDLVHLVTIKPVLLGGMVARLLRIPVVAAISGLGFVFVARGFTAKIRRYLVKILYILALKTPRAVVICQNQHDADLINHLGINTQNIHLIAGSGVDLSLYRAHAMPPQPFVILMAARLLADKGVFEFVEAARQIKNLAADRACQSVRFLLAGDIDLGNPTSVTRDDLELWVKEGAIEWLGQQNNMHELFPVVHLVVLPSYREGLPKVLIEAAACGRAIVTTDEPGCRDALIPNVTGLLVPARDADALTQAILSLIDAPEKCTEMGRAGRIFAEQKFNVQTVIDRHLLIYAALLEKK